jgi:hypothetical protein
VHINVAGRRGGLGYTHTLITDHVKHWFRDQEVEGTRLEE